jgi:hypothetical protein
MLGRILLKGVLEVADFDIVDMDVGEPLESTSQVGAS